MSDGGDGGDAAGAAESGADLDFEEGRYLYCAVYVDDPDADFSADGIEGGSPSLVVHEGIGVVVQPVESAFDSDDVTQVRSWLLSHQQVVDEAGRAFGTPLPFRFDTILRGDDGTVREWLADHRGEIDDALDWLAGRWEYRIEVRWDETAVGEAVREEDEELRELADRVEGASEGTGFLLEKQYRQRLSERVERRRERLEERLREGIEPHVVEMELASGGSDLLATESGDGMETAVELSVLADGDREEAIGEVLESIADRPDHEVQYTGPWPPYSFAPTIGEGGEDAT